MEAYPSMIWMQPPGTATVRHVFLDCYQASGDGYFLDSAAEVAAALLAAQRASGGWTYLTQDPRTGNSTGTFIRSMTTLMQALRGSS